MALQTGATYFFKNSKGGTYLNLGYGSDTSSVYGCVKDGLPSQQWTVENAGNGEIYLKNGRELYLGIAGAPRNGAPVCKSRYKQSWNASFQGSSYVLYYPGTNFIVDLDFGKSANGTKVQLWTFGHCQNQYWIAESSYSPPPPVKKPYDLYTLYVLVNKRAGTAVTLQRVNAGVVGDPVSGEENQMWLFEQGTGDYVYIRHENLNLNHYLSTANSPENGEAIICGTKKQNWEIRKEGQDFRIFYPGTNYNIELHRGFTAAGTAIQLYASWANDQQIWKFQPVT